MKAKTKKLLKAIDAVLSDVTEEDAAAELWAVLSALRGPDSDDPASLIKDVTVAVIRRAAFPKAADRGYVFGALFAPDAVKIDLEQGREVGNDQHFYWHTRKAAMVLGLYKSD